MDLDGLEEPDGKREDEDDDDDDDGNEVPGSLETVAGDELEPSSSRTSFSVLI